jgi:hypothetical protein
MSWEGEAPAEPKTVAIGDWRLATAASEVVKPKIFSAVQKLCPPEKPFATRRSLLATHYSPFATRYSLPFPLLPTFTPSPLLPSLLSVSPL